MEPVWGSYASRDDGLESLVLYWVFGDSFRVNLYVVGATDSFVPLQNVERFVFLVGSLLQKHQSSCRLLLGPFVLFCFVFWLRCPSPLGPAGMHDTVSSEPEGS